MKRPNEKPLTPDSLAADGNQGAGAKARGQCRAKPSPQEATALVLALAATDAAREQLHRYAGMTAEPRPGAVEAADLLDAAAQCLGSMPAVSHAIASARRGDA